MDVRSVFVEWSNTPGHAKFTPGFDLPAKFVIATVGPMDGDPEMLEKAYRSCLYICADEHFESVAFPCIR
jgi:O-acetyl-ADP-ribose deacetylase (regulator of RNase III)